MRSELFHAVREATEGEFELLGQLDGGESFAAYLARGVAGHELAVLVLREGRNGGEFDMEDVRQLDAAVPLGWTRCPGCGAETEGWPRLCGACGRDVSGVTGDEAVPGGSARELLEAVREAAQGEFEVLGSMARAEGGGEVYFARELATGQIVGLSLQLDPDGEYSLALSWSADRGDEEPLAVTPVQDVYDAPAWEPPAAPESWQAPVLPGDGPGAEHEPPSRHEPPAALLGVSPETAMGSRDRTVRLGMYALAGVLVVGAAALLVIADGDGTPERQVVLPAPPVADTVREPAPVETPLEAASPRPSRPVRTEAEPRPTPSTRRPAPATTAQAAPSRPSEPRPEVASAPATDEARVAAALRQYADAVRSRQTSRIRSAYPGITAAEVERWERFFQPLDAAAGLRTRYVVERGPEVQGNVATVIFTMTLSYRDASGSPVELPLPMRGVLERSGTEWRLQEVRSL